MNKYLDMKTKNIKGQEKLLLEKVNGNVSDNDIWNLKFLITQIDPYSRNWYYGCIKSLRRAIKALERENAQNLQVL